MGHEDWPGLIAQLDEVRERVRQHFDAVIADPEEEADEDARRQPLPVAALVAR